MSMRHLLAGYAVVLTLFIIACSAIERNAAGLNGVRWVRRAFCVALAGLLLAMCQPFAPAFFSAALPQVSVFAALVLFHLAVEETLEHKTQSPYFSMAIGAAVFLALLFCSAIHAHARTRIYVGDTADAIQAMMTAVVLFRSKNAALRSAIRTTGYLMAAVAVIHIFRIVAATVRPPQHGIMHADPFQAYFIFFNFTFGIGAGLSLIWLSFCCQRDNLQALALTDGLTGLLNRRAFEEALQRELVYARRYGKGTGLVLIDLDYFKRINDAHGHPVGDEVIRRVSATLQAGTRGSDALARFGGEEFIVMLRDTDPFHASTAAERMRLRVEALRGLPAGIQVTASLGVAVGDSSDTIESLLKKADDALYASKRAGRNTVTSHQTPVENVDAIAGTQSELLPT
jgi:diguanylate cyclase (GGDEF)-like protein